ncbi:MAG TPA: TolC family protein, partial [Fimbriimonas sp.]|nr:TolC family protein [Fimbriimonas sp.]
MKSSKRLSILAVWVLAAVCAAQQQPGVTPPQQGNPPPPTKSPQELTPPIQPKITPVPTPPVITLPPPPGQPVAGPMITAEDAAQVGLKHQPQIAIARAAIRAAHGNVLIAEQSLLPNGTVGGGFTNEYALPIFGGTRGTSLLSSGFSANVSVSQLIFDFGRTLDAVHQAEAQERAATFGLTTTESDTVYQVKQSFYNYAQAIQSIHVAEANLKDRQDNLALAQAQLNAGLGAPADVVTAQTNVAAATVQLTTARNTAALDEITLAMNMGIDPRTP